MNYSQYHSFVPRTEFPKTREQIYNECPKISCMLESKDLNKGNLYLGNMDAASNYETLRQHRHLSSFNSRS